jgi:hypothetical protein
MPAIPVTEATRPRLGRLAEARACWVKAGAVMEGRGALRIQYDDAIVITPWDMTAGAPAGPSLLAGGRDLSSGGLSFSHVGPLPHRHVAVSFRGDGRDEEGRPIVETLIVRLIWCRFTRRGIYLSGGRFEGTLSESFGRPLAVLLDGAKQ